MGDEDHDHRPGILDACACRIRSGSLVGDDTCGDDRRRDPRIRLGYAANAPDLARHSRSIGSGAEQRWLKTGLRPQVVCLIRTGLSTAYLSL